MKEKQAEKYKQNFKKHGAGEPQGEVKAESSCTIPWAPLAHVNYALELFKR